MQLLRVANALLQLRPEVNVGKSLSGRGFSSFFILHLSSPPNAHLQHMEGPSDVKGCDALLALRLQLEEAGAGQLDLLTICDLVPRDSEDANFKRDHALACDLWQLEIQHELDAHIAHQIAAEECGGERTTAMEESFAASPIKANKLLSPMANTASMCLICFEYYSSANRFAPTTCNHTFCNFCIRKMLVQDSFHNSKFPFLCPSCCKPLDHMQCLKLMSGTGRAYRSVEKLIINRLHAPNTVYCVYKDCSEAFELEHEGKRTTEMVTCPVCNRAMCLPCRSEPHSGRSCKENMEFLDGTHSCRQLAKKQGWMKCPKCEHHVSKREDQCNFVNCRCGCGFCYACGKEYEYIGETANNAHGKPSCQCGLFPNYDVN